MSRLWTTGRIPERAEGWTTWSHRFALAIGLLLLILWMLDRWYPVAEIPRAGTVVVAADGTPLRAFTGEDGLWRYPVQLDQVSPEYIELLLAYEDRWFYYHPGINPLAILRAFAQNLSAGRVVSGGSTLTMQVARLLYPEPQGGGRSYAAKAVQMLRALQLEWHLSKAEILTAYLNLAPFGGMLSGVQAASFYYFDKPALALSDAEAALLAVLPQRPSAFRPDRHPQRAEQARNKVLRRMQALAVWPQARVSDALQEPMVTFARSLPQVAPLLSRRLQQQCPQCELINTHIDYELQLRLEAMVAQYSQTLSEEHSVAVMVMNNQNGAVEAYIGSADFWDTERAGQVDIIRAVRSPGSTLKPFLYGFALDDGLIHSHSLLIDAPRHKSRYRPQNFSGFFNGPVTAADALQRSLNVPAVQLLEHLGSATFISRLQQGGLVTFGAGSRAPNTSVILGGIGVQMERLIGLYSGLARQGQAVMPKLRKATPLRERYLMSPGAAWIVRDMLTVHPYRKLARQTQQHWQLAWKTGTSYGFREAWAMGVSDRWTLGVWVGRPDGSASPGRYGRVTAAPLLFRIYAALDTEQARRTSSGQPDTVSQAEICWPAGSRADLAENRGQNCLQRYPAYLLNDTAPRTLTETPQSQHLNTSIATIWIDPQSGKRSEPVCRPGGNLQPETITLWPVAVQPWLPTHWRNERRLPPLADSCAVMSAGASQPLRITSWPDNAMLQLPAAYRSENDGGSGLEVNLRAEGGHGARDWYLNGGYIGRSDKALTYRFKQAGRYQISVVDQQGSSDMIQITVRP